MDYQSTTAQAVSFGTAQPTESGKAAETEVPFHHAESSPEPVGAVVIGLISAIGLFCNVLVILVITVLKDYKKTTHWYVLNLAIADSLFLVLLPLNLVQNVTGKWTLGLPACVAFQGGFYMNYYAGVLFLGVMSFDRYVAIAHPVSNAWRRIRSKTGSLLLALAVWLIAIGAAAPLMAKTSISSTGVCDFSFDYVHPDCVKNGITSASHCELWRRLESAAPYTLPPGGDEDEEIENYLYDVFTDGYEEVYEGGGFNSQTEVPCNYTPAEPRDLTTEDCYAEVSEEYVTWIIGNFVLSFVLPLTVMACCYGGILYRIQHPRIRSSSGTLVIDKKRKNSSNKSDNKAKGLDKKVRITVLVVSLVVVFVCCWSPLHAVVLARINGIDLPNQACYRLRNAAVLIAYSNSLLNPIMYTFLAINFGKRLKTATSRILGRSVMSKLDGSSKKESARNVSGNSSKTTKISFTSEPQIPLSTFALHPHAGNNHVLVVESDPSEPMMKPESSHQNGASASKNFSPSGYE